jgi:hypothetical protein
MRTSCSGLLIAALLSCAVSSAAAQPSRNCEVRIGDHSLRGGRELQVHYQLSAAPVVCDVTAVVLGDGQPYKGRLTISGTINVVAPGTAEKQISFLFDRDVDEPSIQKDHNVVTFRFEDSGPSITIRVDAVAQRPASRRVQIGGGWFGAMESRQSTPSLGSQQSTGVTGRLGLPNAFARGLELGFEAVVTTQDTIDSELFSLASERRTQKDSFFSATVGYAAPLGTRVTLVPTGGIGLGMLDGHRYRYTVGGGGVVTAEESESGIKPALTVGGDLRARVVSRLEIVGGYRMHLPLGAGEGLLERSALHRFTVGLQVNAGGAP